jgi:NAD(P)H-binding
VIAIIGATGEVGRVAAAALSAAGHRLRLGARDPDALPTRTRGGGERVAVNVTDPRGLRAFCRGADVVLGAAGPSHELGAVMLAAALEAGVCYVDPGGDEALHAVAAEGRRRDAREVVVLSAGMVPGLSGLLARRVTASLGGRPHRLVLHAGGRYRFTAGAAADFVAAGRSTVHTAAGRRWRHGAVVPAPLAEDATLPTVPHPVTALPYLTGEVLRLAQALALDEAASYTMLDGAATTAAVRDLALTPERLRRVTEADSAGRNPYALVVARAEDAETVHEIALRGADAGRLTGAVAALTAAAVAAGDVPPGVHYAAEVLDPVRTLAALQCTEADLVVTDTCRPRSVERIEEGVL